MVQDGNNCKGNNQSISGDRGMECLRAAFQAYGENVNREFQEIRNILANINLRLGNGATSCIVNDQNLLSNHSCKARIYQKLQDFPAQKRYHPKLELPTFHGYMDMEDFLVWSSKVEECLDMYQIPEDREAKYVASKLRGRALAWWENIQNRRRNQGKHSVKTWRKMKKIMMKQFLPSGYQQHFFQNYQQYKQGSGSVRIYTDGSFSVGACCNIYETPGQSINSQESLILTIDEGCLVDVQEENRYGYCEEEVEIAKEEEKSVICVDEVETGEEDNDDKHLICVFTDPNVYHQEQPSHDNKFIPWLGMKCGNQESRNLANLDVVVQEEVEMEINSSNSKNKPQVYQHKQIFIVSRDVLIFFSKEFVPAGTFRMLMSPKRYVYFKVRKKKNGFRHLGE